MQNYYWYYCCYFPELGGSGHSPLTRRMEQYQQRYLAPSSSLDLAPPPAQSSSSSNSPNLPASSLAPTNCKTTILFLVLHGGKQRNPCVAEYLRCWTWDQGVWGLIPAVLVMRRILWQALNPHCLWPPCSNRYQLEWKLLQFWMGYLISILFNKILPHQCFIIFKVCLFILSFFLLRVCSLYVIICICTALVNISKCQCSQWCW